MESFATPLYACGVWCMTGGVDDLASPLLPFDRLVVTVRVGSRPNDRQALPGVFSVHIGRPRPDPLCSGLFQRCQDQSGCRHVVQSVSPHPRRQLVVGAESYLFPLPSYILTPTKLVRHTLALPPPHPAPELCASRVPPALPGCKRSWPADFNRWTSKIACGPALFPNLWALPTHACSV